MLENWLVGPHCNRRSACSRPGWWALIAIGAVHARGLAGGPSLDCHWEPHTEVLVREWLLARRTVADCEGVAGGWRSHSREELLPDEVSSE